MDHEPRIRVTWSGRSERQWCAGATRPPAPGELEIQTGWTSFFRLQGVMERLRRGSAARPPTPGAEPPAPLPRQEAEPEREAVDLAEGERPAEA